MMKARTASTKNDEPRTGKRKKRAACKRYIVKKTHLRPIASENQAQRNRPAPLAMEIMLTSHAAVAGATPDSSCAIGSASEMMEMPAVTFRNRSAQSAYHCQVFKAPLSSKSTPERSLVSSSSGSQPSGFHPSGGFFIKNPAPTTMT